MKGGARARSGPAPDPNALRRDRDAGDWITLDPEGRKDAAPAWPLGDDVEACERKVALLEDDPRETKTYFAALATARQAVLAAELRRDREAELWAIEWKRPQATMWERNGQELEVALYVRSFVDAEDTSATTAARTLVKQMQESLGLSLPGLHRNRWTIAAVPSESTTQPTTRRRSSRTRFQVIDGGGGS